jgi:DNA-binding response OmpR family regulator
MQPRHVLIVHDEPLITRALQRLLRDHHVVIASTAAEAIACAALQAFDVAIYDLNLRDGSGLDAARHVTARRRVLMSGSVLEGPAAVALEAEGFLWLPKPFHRDDLASIMAA